MLQVSTGIYFRDGVELHETEHRRPIFCNLQLIGRDQIDIGTGSMSPETSLATDGATALWVTLVERLEATRPDGTDEFLVSTGGDEIYEDLAAILSFAFNAVFDLDHDRARQLIGERSRRPRTRRGAFISRMFDNDVRVTDEEIDEAKAFTGQLLALSRPEYERALRAIKRIVNAARRCVEDPTQAYTDYVASLEALSDGFDPPGLDWERLDSRKRTILKPALQDLSPEESADLQAAILEAERAGSKHRFVEFVRHHLTPDFYTQELPPNVHPIRPTSVPRALARARDAARRFRSALELKGLLSPWSERFPCGACGAASDLLGQYLIDCGEWDYCGGGSPTNGGTHAWLERGEWLDITSDQFPDVDEPVILTTGRSWHQLHFAGGRQRKAGLLAWEGAPAAAILRLDYDVLRARADEVSRSPRERTARGDGRDR